MAGGQRLERCETGWTCHPTLKLVPQDGLEPPTCGLLSRCSDGWPPSDWNKHTFCSPYSPSCRLWIFWTYSVLFFLRTNWATEANWRSAEVRLLGATKLPRWPLVVKTGLEPVEYAERISWPEKKMAPHAGLEPAQNCFRDNCSGHWANEAWKFEDRMRGLMILSSFVKTYVKMFFILAISISDFWKMATLFYLRMKNPLRGLISTDFSITWVSRTLRIEHEDQLYTKVDVRR